MDIASPDISIPRLTIHYFNQGHRYCIIKQYLSKYHSYEISTRTIRRILRRHSLKRNNITISAPEFESAVREIQHFTDKRAGYRRTWLTLQRRYHLKATQDRVRRYLKVLNPAAVRTRVQGLLIRRSYFSAGPNHVWHCDGYDKLKPYGFALHGCVDGFSRKILWVNCCTTNNDPKVILHHFLTTVREVGGCPTLLRSDCGTETILVSAAQCALRDNERAHVFGPSYRNQRIECWWSMLRKSWSQIWIDLFDDLLTFGSYDPMDEVQRSVAEFCFMPVIQNELDAFKDWWNNHWLQKTRTSGCPGGIPTELYGVSEFFGFPNNLKSVNMEHVEELLSTEATRPRFSSNCQLWDLCQLFLESNQLQMPCTRQEAIELYLRVYEYVFER